MSKRRKRILIVEDQQIIATDLEEMLEGLEYVVVGYSPTGEDAVRKAAQREPDLVLMDIRLGGEMDGVEAARLIRAHRDIPVVYLTAYADEETIARARVTGPFGYIVKPVDQRELRAAIEVALYKHDIDRELAVERARRELAEDAQLLIDSVQDYAIFRLDPGGRIVSWNAGAERIKGYSAEEVIGRPFAELFPPDDIAAERPEALLEQTRQEGRAEYEGWRLRKDGSRYWAHVNLTALRDGQEVRGVSVIIRDLTARQLAEESLHEAHHQKDWFIAMLGHELRNPLAAIRTATEVLKLAPDEPEVRERTQAILERQTFHMARLIDDLLDVSRIVRGKIRIEKEIVDLPSIAREAVHDRTAEIQARGLELRTDLGDDRIWVEGDRVRLAQVFHNLLGNAIRFTDPPGTITVTVKREGGNGVVRVRDSGVGIEPDLLGSVFEPFRQAPQSLDRGPGGLGLGLAIVKGVVSLHGGTVEVSSAGPGKGSEFTLRFPVSAERGVTPAEGVPRSSARRVLIVEDNADAADLLGALLGRVGHEVSVAYDGESALEMARELRPEVVLCDIGLPGEMNGYDVARALRDEGSRGALLVALTGYGRPEDVTRAEEAGFDAHLTKPASLDAIETLLSRKLGPAPRGAQDAK